jgi:CrcB protein
MSIAWQLMLVALGGASGSVLRFLVTKWCLALWPNYVGAGTLIVNVLGSFGIGLVLGISVPRTAVADEWRLFLVAGFLGGFTTFSALAFETSHWWMRAAWIGWAHLAANLCLGLLGVAAGDFVGKLFNRAA